MGSGKSTVGKKLAQRLNYQFVDLDDAISNDTGQSISELFSSKGETFFREIEANVLERVLGKNTKKVISLGGGTVCFGSNLSLIKSKAVLIYLELSPKALFNRLLNAKKNRPLIAHLSDIELESYINSKLKEREKFYTQAHIQLNALSINIEDIIKTLNI